MHLHTSQNSKGERIGRRVGREDGSPVDAPGKPLALPKTNTVY